MLPQGGYRKHSGGAVDLWDGAPQIALGMKAVEAGYSVLSLEQLICPEVLVLDELG